MTISSKINYPDELPITAHRDEIIEAIDNNNVVIIAGDTGSGKTTQLPKMCLEAGRGQQRMIGCTQPRRIAAITVAAAVIERQATAQPGFEHGFCAFDEKLVTARYDCCLCRHDA